MLLHFNTWDVKTAGNAVGVVKALGPDGLSIGLPTFDMAAEAEAAILTTEKVCK